MLLVDDNAEMRRAIREQISKQEGMKVVGECANGLEALEFLGKTAVDAMVLDIIMPQMDGYALMEEMRRQQMDNAPQIIVTTALGRDDFIMRAVELGAKYYMSSPLKYKHWWRESVKWWATPAVSRRLFTWVRSSAASLWTRSCPACS